MAEYREVTHKRLYVKEPGTERLRSGAAGWLRHRLATGWKETERWHADHYVTVRLERVAPILVSAARTSDAVRSRSGMVPISGSKGAATSR